MKYRIVPLKMALQDIRDIQTYLEQFYPSTPKKFSNEFARQLNALRSMPRMGETYHARPVYRRIFVHDYAVFYRIDEDKKIVRIYRVLHGARDFEHFL